MNDNELEEQIVFTKDDRVITNSFIVAQKFEKMHKDVLRTIRNLVENNECPKEFWRRNFTPSYYINEQNKEQPMFEITKEGFMFLVFGFTGKKAAIWKIKFIESFNAMEKALIEGQGMEIPSTIDVTLKLKGHEYKGQFNQEIKQERANQEQADQPLPRIHMPREKRHCKRCNNIWQSKILSPLKPKKCPRCGNGNWAINW